MRPHRTVRHDEAAAVRHVRALRYCTVYRTLCTYSLGLVGVCCAAARDPLFILFSFVFSTAYLGTA